MRGLGFIKSEVGPKMGAVDYLRCFLPLKELNEHDPNIEVYTIDGKMMVEYKDDRLIGMDFYHMSRMYGEGYEKFLDPIRASGAFTSFDVDDDLSEPYMWIEKETCEIFKEVLGVVDFVSVSTDYLGDKLSQYTKRHPVTIPNYIDYKGFVEEAARAKRFIPGLTCGFAGTMWHINDWAAVYPVLKRLGDSIQPLHLGYGPDWRMFMPELMLIEQVDYKDYAPALSQFDILLCPVEPTEFANSKSDVKALDAMALGIVPVCSSSIAYMKLAQEGAPIVLVPDQEPWGSFGNRDFDTVQDMWYTAVKRLVDNKERRLNLGKLGRKWVEAHRDMRTVGWKKWSYYFRGSKWIWDQS